MTMINGVDRDNLRKLADYLLALPEDYRNFDMNHYLVYYTRSVRPPFTSPYDISKGALAECGTAACAAGHGPAAGIAAEAKETWPEYVSRTFVNSLWGGKYNADISRVWSWCFDSGWTPVDNTPQGAASRIYWYLDRGVPSNALEQMCREAPLCYAGYGPEENQ